MDRKIERSFWKRRKNLITGSGIALLALVLFWVSRTEGSRVKIDDRRLRIATVERGEFQEFIALNGTVIPISTLYLDAIEGGRVEVRFIEAGTYVEKGQEILRLGNTNLLLDIMYREAELFQQSNNLRNTKLAMEQNRLALQSQILDLDYQIKQARRVHERNAKLAKKELIPVEEFESTRDEYLYLLDKREVTLKSYNQDSLFREIQIRQLEAGLQRMEDNLKIVKQNVENLTITAPVSGHLTSLNAEIGESKVRGERLGQIDILDGFKIRIPVDEHYITRVEVGQRGHFTLDNQEYEVVMDKIYPEVINGQFRVEMLFGDAEPENIRRGQTIHLRLELGEPREAITLRTGPFFQDTGGRWAYVLGGDGKAYKRQIRLGRKNQDVVEVLEGLEPGERVITSSYTAFGDHDMLILNNDQ